VVDWRRTVVQSRVCPPISELRPLQDYCAPMTALVCGWREKVCLTKGLGLGFSLQNVFSRWIMSSLCSATLSTSLTCQGDMYVSPHFRGDAGGGRPGPGHQGGSAGACSLTLPYALVKVPYPMLLYK
jgi:hypothetical protein